MKEYIKRIYKKIECGGFSNENVQNTIQSAMLDEGFQ